MPNVTIKIENLNEIRAAFSKAPAAMTKELDKSIKKSIFAIQGESMVRTPVDTGRLRASHTTLFSLLRGEVGPTANYSLFVHEGTRYMKGRPFLFNAARSQEKGVQDNFKDAVQKVLDDIARQT